MLYACKPSRVQDSVISFLQQKAAEGASPEENTLIWGPSGLFWGYQLITDLGGVMVLSHILLPMKEQRAVRGSGCGEIINHRLI